MFCFGFKDRMNHHNKDFGLALTTLTNPNGRGQFANVIKDYCRHFTDDRILVRRLRGADLCGEPGLCDFCR